MTIKGLAILVPFPSYAAGKQAFKAAVGRTETIRPFRGLFLRHHLSYWQEGKFFEFGKGGLVHSAATRRQEERSIDG
jgi:hypothetical protein